jgi:catechol 2,3-dioxygenase-like lactoylglutathione lyase family enzyme
MTVERLAIALPVSAWRPTLEWYQRVLGCRVVRVDQSVGEVVELRFGRQRFELWLDWGDPAVPLADDRVRAPTVVLGVASVRAFIARLERRGAVVERTPTGFPCVRDPTGNLLLLVPARRKRQTRAQVSRAVERLSKGPRA